MFPRRKSHWLEKQTSRVRDFFFAPSSIIPKPFPIPAFVASKEQYTRIHFVHIYSLSPSPIHVSIIRIPLLYYANCIQEPALLCEPAKNLRDAGKSIAAGFTVALGRITGPDWYIKVRRFNIPITPILTETIPYYRNEQIPNRGDPHRTQSLPPPPPPKTSFLVYRRHPL